MGELILAADGKEVKFTFENKAWCYLRLKIDNEWKDFGGNNPQTIFSKLLVGLIVNRKDLLSYRNFINYKNIRLYDIVSFMGPHGLIYGRNYNHHKELIFVGIEGSIDYWIKLTAEDVENWIEKIIKYFLG